MPGPDFAKLSKKAAEQHGLMTEADADAVGVDQATISQLVESGAWEVVRPGVFRKKANSQTETQQLRALCLWLDEKKTVVSHRSAARLLGFKLDAADLEVTTSEDSPVDVPGVIVHRSKAMDEADHKNLRGIVVTTGARTIIDLAAVVSEEELAFLVEEAWRKQIATPQFVRKRLKVLAKKGRRIGALREILKDTDTRSKPLESALEVKVWRMLKNSGLPLPRPNYEFRDDFGQPGHVDFAYPHCDLAIECDGFEFHNNPKAFEDDRLRAQRLAAVGWRVMPLTWKQVKNEEAKVLERIRHALKFRSRSVRGRP